MKSIYKFPLEVTDSQTVQMPKGATILTVQTQRDTPCIWAIVDPGAAEDETRRFEIFGTGHHMREDMGIDREYIGTFQIRGGSLVFHLFERK